ncbi:hypothetical protein NDU88_000599 [Pleurodeles waltl]|uniref:Uncharacterized protein n=1 Tax=Pleurodeles waltl TaxID=8319 RepID=A0AAV7Q7R7_PLEWA|nr:hypothetical protein NDU88_000599 [Pleurodeles waltl]
MKARKQTTQHSRSKRSVSARRRAGGEALPTAQGMHYACASLISPSLRNQSPNKGGLAFVPGEETGFQTQIWALSGRRGPEGPPKIQKKTRGRNRHNGPCLSAPALIIDARIIFKMPMSPCAIDRLQGGANRRLPPERPASARSLPGPRCSLPEFYC